MEANGVRGVQVGGREPKALLLSNGTRLALEGDVGPGGRADWTVVDDGGTGEISVGDAMRIAGEEHAEYVRIRTQAEIAWLRLVAEWFEDQAGRLDEDLAEAKASRR